MVRWLLNLVKFIFQSWSLGLKSMMTYWCWWNLRPIGWSDWENIEIHVHNTCPSHAILKFWNLTIGFEECIEILILVNYGQNQTVGFRKMRGQCLVEVGQTQSNLIDGPVITGLGVIHIRILVIEIEEYGIILVLVIFGTNWMVVLREQSHTGTQHMSITRHPYIWNLSFEFEKCYERLILVNYGHNQTVGFREKWGQSLFKVGQTQSNLVDGPVNTGLSEIHIQIFIIEIVEYGDILVLGKLNNNWMVRLREQSHTGT